MGSELYQTLMEVGMNVGVANINMYNRGLIVVVDQSFK